MGGYNTASRHEHFSVRPFWRTTADRVGHIKYQRNPSKHIAVKALDINCEGCRYYLRCQLCLW